MQDSTHSANNKVSGIQRNIRLNQLGLAVRSVLPLTAGFAGLLALGSAVADGANWDCRATADGRDWVCFKDGERVIDPPPAESSTALSAAQPPAPVALEPLAESTAQTAVPAATTTSAARPEPAPAPKPVDNPLTRAASEPPPEPAAATATRTAPARPTAPPPATQTGQAAQANPVAPAVTAPSAAAAMQSFHDDAMPDLTQSAPTAAPAAPSSTPVAEPGVAATTTLVTLPVGSGDTPAAAATAIDAGLDWQTCRAAPGERTVTPRAPRLSAPQGPIEITAASAVSGIVAEQAVFSGEVELQRGELRMQADELTLDHSAGEITARGGFLFSQPEIRFAGSAASYQLQSGRAEVEQASYRVPSIRARGNAEHATFFGDGTSRFQNISYTTCAPADNAWLLTAETLELNQNEGFGTAHDAKLSFLGVPMLYVPTFTFPIDDRRRSGVLVPTMGHSSNTGFDVSVPYYVNLAENYDLTLTPRAMSKRGLMLGSEFRFLTATTEGTLTADYLPDDNAYAPGGGRGSASLYSHTDFNRRTEADLRLNYISDNEYFEDLGGSLAATSATHVERAGEVRYHGDTWDLLGRLQYYQTIDNSILFTDRPYSRLPQLRLDLEHPQGIAGTTYHLAAEYANFYRRDSVRGHRVDLAPAISLPLGEPWWFVEPKLGAHYTGYDLTAQAAGLDDSPSNLTGVFSLDSGLLFDRDIDWFGSASSQTLEPRLFYLYVPSNGQADQPLFDTAEFDFGFDNLFRDNRYNGPDRIADANQVTLALTSRVNARDSGAELLRASVGQIIYFEDRSVTLPGEPTGKDTTSALVTEIAAQLGGGWHSRAGLQWDPHDGNDGTIDQALAQVSYRDHDGHVFNAAYRLRDGVTNQTDLAFFWPVNQRLSLIARHNHSLKEDRLLEALAGVEYGSSCCWRVRLLARRYTDDSSDDHNTAFMVQLELNGLGRLGNDIDSTLQRGIYGYRTDDND